MISIGKYIKHVLSGLTESVNSLVLPPNADQLENYIVYKRMSVVPEYTRDGVAFNTTQVQIDIVSQDYGDGIDLAEEVRALFELKDEIYGNIRVQQCTLLAADENTDGSVFIQSLVFEIITN
jgi:hypothetical protein